MIRIWNWIYLLPALGGWWGCFPWGSDGKESICNTGDLGSIPGLGRSHGEGKGYLLQYSCLENSMNCIVHGVTKSGTQLSDFHFPRGKESWRSRKANRLIDKLWENDVRERLIRLIQQPKIQRGVFWFQCVLWDRYTHSDTFCISPWSVHHERSCGIYY